MMGAFNSYAQTFSIGGKVTSGWSDEALPYATVFIQELKAATATDEYGNYQLKNIPPGNYLVEYSTGELFGRSKICGL